MSLKIGVDYGGVCSMHDAKHEDETFSGEVGINIDGCLTALHQLKAMGHTLVLVSFCGARRARETRKYFATLGDQNPFSDMYFVKKRGYKGDVCKKLGLDMLIDDRLDILQNIKPTWTLHFGGHPSDAGSKFKPKFYAKDWAAVMALAGNFRALGVQPDASVDLSSKIY